MMTEPHKEDYQPDGLTQATHQLLELLYERAKSYCDASTALRNTFVDATRAEASSRLHHDHATALRHVQETLRELQFVLSTRDMERITRIIRTIHAATKLYENGIPAVSLDDDTVDVKLVALTTLRATIRSLPGI